MAFHYAEAGLVVEAIPHLRRAGERAVASAANREAVQHLTRALDLLATLPANPERDTVELSLLLPLGVAWMAVQGYAAPETERAFARAHTLCRGLGETPALVPILSGLLTFAVVRAELARAREIGEQLLAMAQRTADGALLANAHLRLAVVCEYEGRPRDARSHAEECLARSSESESVPAGYSESPITAAGVYRALALWRLGYPDQALAAATDAVERARRMNHPLSLAQALILALQVRVYRREWEVAREEAAAAIDFCTEKGFPLWAIAGAVHHGGILAELGRVEDAVGPGRAGYRGVARDRSARGQRRILHDVRALLRQGRKRRRWAAGRRRGAGDDRGDRRAFRGCRAASPARGAAAPDAGRSVRCGGSRVAPWPPGRARAGSARVGASRRHRASGVSGSAADGDTRRCVCSRISRRNSTKGVRRRISATRRRWSPRSHEERRNRMAPTVAILGGGVAGLSAAHELVERGFEVTVYEKHHIPGGKARSFPKRGTGTAPRNDLPGEHGFRFFPGFYQHLPDTMRRIPFHGQPDGVFGNLVEATRVEIAQDGKKAIISAARFPESLADLECDLPGDARVCRSRHSGARDRALRRPPAAPRVELSGASASASTRTRAGGSSSARPTAPQPTSASSRSDSAGRWSPAAPRRSAPAPAATSSCSSSSTWRPPACRWTGS